MGKTEPLQCGQEVVYIDVIKVYEIRSAIKKVDRDQKPIVSSSKRITHHMKTEGNKFKPN